MEGFGLFWLRFVIELEVGVCSLALVMRPLYHAKKTILDALKSSDLCVDSYN